MHKKGIIEVDYSSLHNLVLHSERMHKIWENKLESDKKGNIIRLKVYKKGIWNYSKLILSAQKGNRKGASKGKIIASGEL